MDLESELRRLITEQPQRIVLVVGAGATVAALQGSDSQSLTSWTGLLRSGLHHAHDTGRLSNTQLEDHLRSLNHGAQSSLLSIAHVVEAELQGGEFRRWLRETVGNFENEVRDSSILNVLAELQRRGAILATTNYDNLLGKATGLRAATWLDRADVEHTLSGDEPHILHFHGSWRKPESIVLGPKSYQSVAQNKHASAVLTTLRTMGTLVFIGCGSGLEDPNMGSFLKKTEEIFAQSEYRHFRLCRKSEVTFLRGKHPAAQRIFPLSYGERHSDLAPFLQSLLVGGANLGRSRQPAYGSVKKPRSRTKLGRILAPHRPSPPRPDIKLQTGQHPLFVPESTPPARSTPAGSPSPLPSPLLSPTPTQTPTQTNRPQVDEKRAHSVATLRNSASVKRSLLVVGLISFVAITVLLIQRGVSSADNSGSPEVINNQAVLSEEYAKSPLSIPRENDQEWWCLCHVENGSDNTSCRRDLDACRELERAQARIGRQPTSCTRISGEYPWQYLGSKENWSTSDKYEATQVRNVCLLSKVREWSPSSWVVRLSADGQLDRAVDNLNQFRRQSKHPATVLLARRSRIARPQFFVVIGAYSTREDAEREGRVLRSLLGEGYWVHRIADWCPEPKARGAYYDCEG